MEESGLKRKRVSPQTAGAANDQGAASETAGPRRKRPSFASPTKASLSRHNPEILERRRSASPAKPTGSQPVVRRASHAGSDASLSELLTTQPAATAGNFPASDANPDQDEAREAPSERRPGTGATSKPSPAKPNPRPLPPPAPEGEDEMNPFIGHTLRRSPATGVPIPPRPEPELPPAVPDPVLTTPPRGIHSSPSRWREKAKNKKGSPLKPAPERPGTERSKTSRTTSRDASRKAARNDESSRTALLDPNTNRARQIAAYDPNMSKLKEKSELQKEIDKLKSDLKLASEENERLRLMQTSGRTVAPTNEDGIVDLLYRCLVSSEEPPRPALSQQLTQAVLNPMNLLTSGLSSAVPAVHDNRDEFENIKSHHPVPMTAEEELPYLQLFSPFSVTSRVAVLPLKPNKPVRQRHLITLRSRDVPGLFTARLEMVVNAFTLGVKELSVTSIEPSAKFELQPFADLICGGNCNRTMQRNVGVLSWAMGEWYRIATQRALFWTQLDQEFGTKEKLLESVANSRQGRPRRRQQQPDEDDESDQGSPVKQAVCDKASLIRFLGQQSFEITVPSRQDSGGESTLRLEWKIGFDWTGEARSDVAILVGVPGKWHNVDDRGTLGQIPKLFKDLIGGGQEPEEAVRTITALLAGA
ncbi:hypothetical protein CDD83_3590 [Cordyceps sp. RAO-2017]|nr:hypothetical protein CDD83_3590 [Cordyceps sp. RAO-2017]